MVFYFSAVPCGVWDLGSLLALLGCALRCTGIRPPSTPHFPLSAALVATAPVSHLAFVILPFSSVIRVARGLPVLLVFFSVVALSR